MMQINMPPERLFLERSKMNVFVDMIGLMAHQYEGIRFLYKQYKKGQPGVVLNDPPRYGKRVQIAAFIDAMKTVIKTDSLLICPDNKQEMWGRRVKEWTFVRSEIIIEGAPPLYSSPARSVSSSLNPVLEAQVEASNIQANTELKSGTPKRRPKLIVSALSHLKMVKDRTWGIVVVDLDVVPRALLRSGLKSDFKIWVTGVDVEKNLQDLVLIYKWIFEKKFDIEQFTPVNETPRAVLAASIKLSAFTEDFVLRRKNVDIDNILNANKSTEMLAKYKIKRSKPISDNEPEVDRKHVSNKIGDIKHLEIADKPITDVDSGGKDIETQSPKQSKKRRIEQKEKEHVDMEVEEEMADNDAEQDITTMDCESLDYELRYESDTQENDDPLIYESDKAALSVTDAQSQTNDEVMHDNIEKDVSIADTQVISHENEYVESKGVINIKMQEDISIKNDSGDYDDLNVGMQEDATVKNVDAETAQKDIKSDEFKVKATQPNANNASGVSNELESNVSDNKTDRPLTAFEQKIKEMEEQALKKFKGSDLDKFF